MNIYVGHLQRMINQIPKSKEVCITCSVGHRASLGASILARAGYSNIFNLLGGMIAWNACN